MCGVAGAFAYRGSGIDLDELTRVRDSMAARGPDGKGIWTSADGRVGLAHRRLAILDLSPSGAQPMADASGRFVISYNGEIFNHTELRAELEADGVAFHSRSDTEVVLALYAKLGDAMLGKLRGMYAFAIWDARDKSLFLARDPFGIKPLYVADDGRIFRFASSVKGLLQAAVDKGEEPAGHVGFFLWGAVPEPWTFYKGIRALPAGHGLRVAEDGVGEPRALLRLSDVLMPSFAASATRSEALGALSEALRDSMCAHIVSDVPVAVFLSSGLDSTLAAAEVAALGVRPKTVTLAFREYAGKAEDETPLAEMVARELGADHSTVFVSREDFRAETGAFFGAMDQPTIDGVNTWFVARAAASRGLKVALSGLGGDELFASYPSFHGIPRLLHTVGGLARWPKLGAGFRWVAAPLVSRIASPKYAGLLEYGGSVGSAYLLRRALFMPWELPDVLDPDMVREGWRKLESRARLDATAVGAPNIRMAISALEMSWYMRQTLLRDADWAGMAHSVEIRVPFVDLPLVKKAAAVFASYPDFSKREVFAAAISLPKAVLDKPKTGFSVPMREWMAGGEMPPERGLRGWSRLVYRRYMESVA